jgi:hypothetical protein
MLRNVALDPSEAIVLKAWRKPSGTEDGKLRAMRHFTNPWRQ